MHGFSLLELMIALIIVGILSAVCVPIYSDHLIHARRLEAEVNLIKLANALEQFHLVNNTYQNADLAALGFPNKIADNQYHLLITQANDDDYAIEARPLDKQAQSDVLCASLRLSSDGKREITGTGKLTDCWR
jgi:type IV pilus assembly protein PilE